MPHTPTSTLLVSDFNIDLLAGYLSNDPSLPKVQSVTAPFGQTAAVLLNPNSEYWQKKPDCVVLWTQPDAVSVSFKKLLNFEPVGHELILEEVDAFARTVKSALGRAGVLILPTWVVPSYERGLGVVDMRPGQGIAHCLMRMNLRMTEHFKDAANVYFLNTQQFIERVGIGAFNPKLWYMGKIPFGNEVFKLAAQEIKAVVRAMSGLSKKIIIVDLDDTLWGGVVGEDGMEHLQLGGHDPAGEAFVDFQRALLRLTKRGIVLGIVSKNEESVALAAMEQHPEMVLRKKDFAGWRINWEDKAKNISDLLQDLNLGADAAVFIDDNPAERERVRQALPGVLVPEWPQDKMLYRKFLSEMNCFDTIALTAEDAARTQMYTAELHRKDAQKEAASLDDWLKGLGVKVTVEELNAQNLPRASQLLNKTNQMNLQTRRLPEEEFSKWNRGKGRKVWTFRVADKFGDSGLVGLASVEIKNGNAELVDFLLSCRVFGRRIEDAMLAVAARYSRRQKAAQLTARYVPTEKNKPCLEFLQRARCSSKSGDLFCWDLKKEIPFPQGVEVILHD